MTTQVDLENIWKFFMTGGILFLSDKCMWNLENKMWKVSQSVVRHCNFTELMMEDVPVGSMFLTSKQSSVTKKNLHSQTYCRNLLHT